MTLKRFALSRPRTLPETVRRRRILEAARRILARNGYRDVSLDDVARHAGVAKGTLYLYFKDKSAPLEAVFQDLTARLEEKLARIPPCDGTAEALRRLAEAHLAFADKHRDFLAALAPGSPALRTKPGRAVHEKFSGCLERLADGWVRPCIASGALRRHDPRLGAMFFFSLMRLFMVRKFLSGDKVPLKRHARQLVSLYMSGLETRRRTR